MLRGDVEDRRKARGLAFLAALASLVHGPRAAAEDPDGGVPPSAAPLPLPAPVIHPRLASGGTADYPDGARGDAVVLLELVVTKGGAVGEARVVTGDPPFADAAIRAARAFVFEPATQNGVAVPARIRFLVRFEGPTTDTPAPAAARKTPPAPVPASAPVSGAIDVEVEGQRPEAAVSRLGRAEVRQLPGAFGDPFRAIEAMPGVTPIVSGLPYFFVRGAPPGNLGYFVDGVRVPLLYHVAAGPAVIHPALIEKVDLYPGGYPARYGRFAGGIVAGETRPPAAEAHGEASVRIVDAGGLAEAPLFGHRVTALASGRYGYPGLILRLFAPEALLEYWDYQARVALDLGPDDTLSAFVLGAYDFLGEKKRDGSVEASFATDFHRIDLRYDHRSSARTDFRFAVTAGLDRTTMENDLAVRDRLAGARVELRHFLGPKATLRGGADVNLDVYDVVVPVRDFDDERGLALSRAFPSRADVATGAWADLVLDAARGVHVTPGLRVDLFASKGNTSVGVDPRILADYDVSPKVRLIHAFGIAHQPPSFVIPLPGLQVASAGLQKSAQHSFGVETKLPSSFMGTLTLFQNAFFDFTDVAGSGRLDSVDVDGDGRTDDSFEQQLRRRSLGHTVGLELYVRRPLTHRLGGYLAYTLSRSTRSSGRESRFPANFDRAHVVQAAVTYDLGRSWRAGTRGMVYTGVPVRSQELVLQHSQHPERLRPFYRVDVRLEKRWRLGEHGHWAFVFEVLNATLTKETVDTGEEIGPVTIPSLGVEASL